MKICVVGAGAVGGALAALLVRGGHAVSVVARGAHLRAIQARGLTLRAGGETLVQSCPASDDPADFGAQDIILIGLKAHAVAPMLPRLAPLLGPDTVVIPALNGIPWWYFHKSGGAFEGQAVRCLDPDGAMLAALDPARILGCVVFGAGDVPEPGVVRQTSADQPLTLGEPDGSASPRLARIAAALGVPGMKITAERRIRDVIWTKLLGNVAFNPVSALARANMQQVMGHPRLAALVRALMGETMAVGRAHGVSFTMTVDQRLGMAARLGPVKPSMLQDVEQGRPMEVEAIVGAVAELGRLAGVPTPTVDAVHALIAGRDATLQQGG
ncbi:MAG: 2-dehydropantoate 2-reductase [Alphaproteobacteria bacterium]|nr:2-dehydropantoate 2-reductase [Alphaproteobacteria bacterium]